MVKRILALSLLMVGLAGCGSGDGGGADSLYENPIGNENDLGWFNETTKTEGFVYSTSVTRTPPTPNAVSAPNNDGGDHKTKGHCPNNYNLLINAYQTNVWFSSQTDLPSAYQLDYQKKTVANGATLINMCKDEAYSGCGNATDLTWGITALLNAVRNEDCKLAALLLSGSICTTGFTNGVIASLTQPSQYMLLQYNDYGNRPEKWTPPTAATYYNNKCLIELLHKTY